MKKWIVISSIFLAFVTMSSIIVYFNAMHPVKAAKERAAKMAYEHAALKEIDEFFLYNGTSTYYVVRGINENDLDVIVWIPEKEGNIVVKRASEGITKEKALQLFYNEKTAEKVLSVRLGMENDRPLWEINYRTKGNLLNYYYIDFQTGEKLKNIENL